MIKAALNSELAKIIEISKDFVAKKGLLFGSCLENVGSARDIDIAVSGIKPADFFRYYARLSMAVKDEVDLIDLDDTDDYFSKRIVSKGKVLYERTV